MFDLNKSKASHLIQGELAEKQALTYLKNQGLIFVAQNYSCKHGELDLIMKDKDTLVIVEVRFRKNNIYGSALESVTKKKQNRIINTTHIYLSKFEYIPLIRFDIIAITGNSKIEWIKNAF